MPLGRGRPRAGAAWTFNVTMARCAIVRTGSGELADYVGLDHALIPPEELATLLGAMVRASCSQRTALSSAWVLCA
jgi:hypothetical protein